MTLLPAWGVMANTSSASNFLAARILVLGAGATVEGGYLMM